MFKDFMKAVNDGKFDYYFNIMERELNNFNSKTKTDPTTIEPDYDVRYADNTKKFYIHVNLAGCSKKDITISVDNGYLTIKGDMNIGLDDHIIRTIINNEVYGNKKYVLTLKLNENTKYDLDNMDSKYEDGILYIKLPKLIEKETETKRTFKIS